MAQNPPNPPNPPNMSATHLRTGKWAVRPAGQLGTCGWYPKPWTVVYVSASSEAEALRKAAPLLPHSLTEEERMA